MNRNYWAEHREEKKAYSKEYSKLEIECEVCECKVRKCNWARHVASRKHMLGGGGGKVDGDVGGGGGKVDGDVGGGGGKVDDVGGGGGGKVDDDVGAGGGWYEG